MTLHQDYPNDRDTVSKHLKYILFKNIHEEKKSLYNPNSKTDKTYSHQLEKAQIQ